MNNYSTSVKIAFRSRDRSECILIRSKCRLNYSPFHIMQQQSREEKRGLPIKSDVCLLTPTGSKLNACSSIIGYIELLHDTTARIFSSSLNFHHAQNSIL